MATPTDLEISLGEQRRLEHLKEMSAYATEDAKRVHLRVTAALAFAVLYLTQLPFANLLALDPILKGILVAGLVSLVGAALLYFEYASAAHKARCTFASAIRDGSTVDYADWWNGEMTVEINGESREIKGVWKSKAWAFHWGNVLFGLGALALGAVLVALLA